MKPTLWDIFRHRLDRLRAGLDTPLEFLLLLADHATLRMTGKNPCRQLKKRTRRLSELVDKEKDCYRIKGARLPLLDEATALQFFGYVFEDVFFVYLFHDDCYDEKTIGRYYDLLIEGPFGLTNERTDVRVQPGDVVIDAGSWIGDFAAYASAQGATVYAFEPFESAYPSLLRTAMLNPNIFPIKMGLGDVTGKAFMSDDPEHTLGNAVIPNSQAAGDGKSVKITTLDAFVRGRNLPRVDFIKADIEGYERQMLMGAQETLRKFAPKLALCTYHLPDDPEVLASLIKRANPGYRIVQKRKKLYAAVPERRPGNGSIV